MTLATITDLAIFSWYLRLCGGCQKWGEDPWMEKGICKDCKRSELEIKKEHGCIKLSDNQKEIINIGLNRSQANV